MASRSSLLSLGTSAIASVTEAPAALAMMVQEDQPIEVRADPLMRALVAPATRDPAAHNIVALGGPPTLAPEGHDTTVQEDRLTMVLAAQLTRAQEAPAIGDRAGPATLALVEALLVRACVAKFQTETLPRGGIIAPFGRPDQAGNAQYPALHLR